MSAINVEGENGQPIILRIEGTKLNTTFDAKAVSVLGTGDYGRTLTSRLVIHGYKVVMGSRNPSQRNLASRNPTLADIPVVSMEEAVKETEVVFAAIPADTMIDTLRPLAEVLKGKIFVDVSNNNKIKDGQSHAEEVAAAFPETMVVKAFNTLSAYSLASGDATGNTEVQLASDSPFAREVISTLVRDIGLKVVLVGGLKSARELEKMPLRLWRGWGIPVLVALIIYLGLGSYYTWREHGNNGNPWHVWPTHTNHKIIACTAIILLSLCYLPGCLAAVAQLIYGTKHRTFPFWLDRWMRMRKHLGLLALWLGTVHCILSVAHISPAYQGGWFDSTTVTINLSHTEVIQFQTAVRMNWKGELALLLGVLTLGSMALLGITTLPSVASSLNWRQWNFIQSYIGHLCLFFAGAHDSIRVLPYLSSSPFSEAIQWTSTQTFLIVLFVLAFRLVLLLPCFSITLRRIRGGWERPRKGDTETGNDVIESRGVKVTPNEYANKSYLDTWISEDKDYDTVEWEEQI